MKDEIKEILDELDWYIKQPNNQDINGEYEPPMELSQEEAKDIYDCITNLQQIEQEHKETNATLMSELAKLEEENERLKELCDEYEEEHSNEFQCWKRDRKELLDKRERIQKAIEYNKEIVDNYLEEDDCEYCDGRYATAKHNLNILQNGSDKE